jgi:hypothetical protein
MSLAEPEKAASTAAPQAAGPVRLGWYHKLVGMLFVILCFEVGIFLIAYPWSHYWNSNYFSWLSPGWRELWVNPFFRGAVSGLGLVNLYLSVMEVFRLQELSAALRKAERRLEEDGNARTDPAIL